MSYVQEGAPVVKPCRDWLFSAACPPSITLERRDAEPQGWRPGKGRLWSVTAPACFQPWLKSTLRRAACEVTPRSRDVGSPGQRGKLGGICWTLWEAEIVSLPVALMTQFLTSLKQNGSRKGVCVTTDGSSFSCHNLHCWMVSWQWFVHTFSFWWLRASSPDSFMLKTLVNPLGVDGFGVFIVFIGLFYCIVQNWDQSGNPVGKTWTTLSGLGATKDQTVDVSHMIVGLSSSWGNLGGKVSCLLWLRALASLADTLQAVL